MEMEKAILEKIRQNLKGTNVRVPEGLTRNILLGIREQKAERAGILSIINNIFHTIARPAVLAPVFAALVAAVVFFATSKPKDVQVTFMLHNSDAVKVAVAGDFNDWNPAGYRMVNDREYWQITLNLPPGQYQYMFVIDNDKWISDPENSYRVESAFGGTNSVIKVNGNNYL